MRRSNLTRRGFLAANALLAAGCERSHYIRPRPTVEEDAGAAPPQPVEDVASIVPMADEKLAPQLVSGFHTLEHGEWRWTQGSFSVQLQPPPRSQRTGATLRLEFNLPEPVLSRVKTMTLSAKAGETALPSETYKTSGTQQYVQPIPPASLGDDPVTVHFALDRYLPAGSLEPRELGIIVTRVGLEPK